MPFDDAVKGKHIGATEVGVSAYRMLNLKMKNFKSRQCHHVDFMKI